MRRNPWGNEEKKKGAGRNHISNFVRRAAGYDGTTRDFPVDSLFEDLANTAVGYRDQRMTGAADTAG